MNDNWLEIIDIYNSVTFDKLGIAERLEKIQEWFRILGWRKSNGSMIIDLVVDEDISVPLVLSSSTSGDIIKSFLCVFVDDHDDSCAHISRIEKALSYLECKYALSFGKDISLYVKLEDSTVLNVGRIPFSAYDRNGAKLFDTLSAKNFSYIKLSQLFNQQLMLNKRDVHEKIEKAIEAAAANQELIKQYIVNLLLERGFNNQDIEEVVSHINFMLVTNAEDDKHYSDSSCTGISSVTTHDYTRFSFDGINYYNKRIFVLRLIQKYVEDHPYVTLPQLEEQFPSKIISKQRGVVRPLDMVQAWVAKDPSIRGRFFMQPENIITLCDGTKIVVHNQWGTTHFPSFLQIAKRLYDVTSDKPYRHKCSEMVSSISENPSDSTHEIKISPASLTNFYSKKK